MVPQKTVEQNNPLTINSNSYTTDQNQPKKKIFLSCSCPDDFFFLFCFVFSSFSLVCKTCLYATALLPPSSGLCSPATSGWGPVLFLLLLLFLIFCSGSLICTNKAEMILLFFFFIFYIFTMCSSKNAWWERHFLSVNDKLSTDTGMKTLPSHH